MRFSIMLGTPGAPYAITPCSRATKGSTRARSGAGTAANMSSAAARSIHWPSTAACALLGGSSGANWASIIVGLLQKTASARTERCSVTGFALQFQWVERQEPLAA
jgi:hypothetical protein